MGTGRVVFATVGELITGMHGGAHSRRGAQLRWCVGCSGVVVIKMECWFLFLEFSSFSLGHFCFLLHLDHQTRADLLAACVDIAFVYDACLAWAL